MSQRLKETAVPKRRSSSDLPISQNGDSKWPLLSLLRNTLSKLWSGIGLQPMIWKAAGPSRTGIWRQPFL